MELCRTYGALNKESSRFYGRSRTRLNYFAPTGLPRLLWGQILYHCRKISHQNPSIPARIIFVHRCNLDFTIWILKIFLFGSHNSPTRKIYFSNWEISFFQLEIFCVISLQNNLNFAWWFEKYFVPLHVKVAISVGTLFAIEICETKNQKRLWQNLLTTTKSWA